MQTKPIDKKVVQQFLDGDVQAFNQIFLHYRNAVHFFALRISNSSADAEEIVQDTFTAIYQNIDSLQNVDSFHSWLFSIVYNKSINLVNKNNNQPSIEINPVLENIFPNSIQLEEQVLTKEAVSVIETSFDQLPDNLRYIAILYYLYDLKVKEIATILEISEGTVKSRLSTIRSKTKRVLLLKGYTRKTFFTFFPFLPLTRGSFNKILDNANKVDNSLFETNGNGIEKEPIKFMRSNALYIKTIPIVILSFLSLSTLWNITANSKLDEYPSNNNVNIEYSRALTNSMLQVKLISEQEPKSISIKQDGNEVPYYVEDNEVYFYTSDNDVFVASINDWTSNIEITNIDKSAPVVPNYTYDGSTLTLLFDTPDEIDYEKSNLIYEDQTYDISSKGQVIGNFNGKVLINIQSLAGNSTMYSIIIN